MSLASECWSATACSSMRSVVAFSCSLSSSGRPSACASPLHLIGRPRVEHQASPRPEASDYFRSSEAVQARHIGIKQHRVGVVLRHEPYRLQAIARFADERHMRKEAKQPA